jgi:adenosine deaminase
MDSLRLFPKIDLHRHLEGSLRLATVLEVAQSEGLYPEWTANRLRASVQIGSEDRRHWANFLAKFDVLRPLYRSPELIRRVVAEAIEDAARDGVRHLELPRWVGREATRLTTSSHGSPRLRPRPQAG